MKLTATLALASLLAAGSAFAADATATPVKTATTTAQPDHHCRDEANNKKLAGAARKSFIKKCVADSRAAK